MRTFLPALTTALVLTLAATGLTPTRAQADDLPPTGQFFEEFDTNADGRVTKEEFRGSGEIFKLLDKNGDGTITPDDLGLPADYRPDPKRVRPAPESGPEPKEPADGARARARQRENRKAHLAAMDTDGDGKVSRSEWKGPEGAFDRLDRNGDGVLDPKDGMGGGTRGRGPGGAGPGRGDAKASPEEIEKRATALFGRLDKNQNGKLEGEEIPNPRLLKAADKDGDGAVNEAEFVTVHKAFARRGGRAGGGTGQRGGPRRDRARLTAAMLKRWDGDGDGKVSADEFPGREEMFKMLDADADGSLTEADVAALRKRREQARARKPKAPADAPKPPVTEEATPFRALDLDGDGRLHRGEFKGSAEDWKRLDRNQDGWITPDEMK